MHTIQLNYSAQRTHSKAKLTQISALAGCTVAVNPLSSPRDTTTQQQVSKSDRVPQLAMPALVTKQREALSLSHTYTHSHTHTHSHTVTHTHTQ